MIYTPTILPEFQPMTIPYRFALVAALSPGFLKAEKFVIVCDLPLNLPPKLSIKKSKNFLITPQFAELFRDSIFMQLYKEQYNGCCAKRLKTA